VNPEQSHNLFASLTGAALPPYFAFLPLIDNDMSEKSYDLTVSCGNRLVSNLDVGAAGDGVYRVEGTAASCCLFAGFFGSMVQDGITYYWPECNRLIDPVSRFNESKALRHTDPDWGLSDEPYPPPKKVFVISFYYKQIGFPCVYDDYVIVPRGTYL